MIAEMGDTGDLIKYGAGIALGHAFGGKELLIKVLGPVADDIGAGLQAISRKSVANLKRVFEKAANKIPPKVADTGAVPPKVLHELFEKGQFADSELQAEYFGGVLASSKTTTGDDRGAGWIRIVGDLSGPQVRAHYLIYMSARQALLQPAVITDVSRHLDLIANNQLTLIVLKEQFFKAVSGEIYSDPVDLMHHVDQGLRREGLVDGMGVDSSSPSELRIKLTYVGASLLLWANGLGTGSFHSFTREQLEVVADLPIPNGRVVQNVRNDLPRWG
jgi:hypothetical protein